MIMLVAFVTSRTFINFAAAALAVVVSILLFLGMRTLQRLGQRHSDRRTFSDLPNLVHGPQELPDQSDAVRRERNTLHDA